MKFYTKILIILSLIFSIFIVNSYAWTVELPWMEPIKEISNSVGEETKNWWDIIKVINEKWLSILHIFKTALQWILLIFIIYIGIQMVISMWTDEDKLTKWKNQLWYSLVAIMFINIPWTIYNVINSKNRANISEYHDWDTSTAGNILINNEASAWWLWTLLKNIVWFIEVIIFWIAIFTIIMSWIKIMTARWREEEVTKAKSNILYSITALIFVWFIEAWRRLAMSWDIVEWWKLFWKITEIVLLFAWPVAIFFLTLAWYYYITANWEEDRVKKAKNIIVNTLIWIILCVAMFTFLKDLSNF